MRDFSKLRAEEHQDGGHCASGARGLDPKIFGIEQEVHCVFKHKRDPFCRFSAAARPRVHQLIFNIVARVSVQVQAESNPCFRKHVLLVRLVLTEGLAGGFEPAGEDHRQQHAKIYESQKKNLLIIKITSKQLIQQEA